MEALVWKICIYLHLFNYNNKYFVKCLVWLMNYLKSKFKELKNSTTIKILTSDEATHTSRHCSFHRLRPWHQSELDVDQRWLCRNWEGLLKAPWIYEKKKKKSIGWYVCESILVVHIEKNNIIGVNFECEFAEHTMYSQLICVFLLDRSVTRFWLVCWTVFQIFKTKSQH